MTVNLITEIVSILREAGLTVFDTVVPTTKTPAGDVVDAASYPYVLIEAPANLAAVHRTLGGGSAGRLRVTVTVAGTTPTSCRVVAPKVRTILETIEHPEMVLRFLDGQSLPVGMDSDHNRAVFFCVDFYELIQP
jgi:hypothetical protein